MLFLLTCNELALRYPQKRTASKIRPSKNDLERWIRHLSNSCCSRGAATHKTFRLPPINSGSHVNADGHVGGDGHDNDNGEVNNEDKLNCVFQNHGYNYGSRNRHCLVFSHDDVSEELPRIGSTYLTEPTIYAVSPGQRQL